MGERLAVACQSDGNRPGRRAGEAGDDAAEPIERHVADRPGPGAPDAHHAIEVAASRRLDVDLADAVGGEVEAVAVGLEDDLVVLRDAGRRELVGRERKRAVGFAQSTGPAPGAFARALSLKRPRGRIEGDMAAAPFAGPSLASVAFRTKYL